MIHTFKFYTKKGERLGIFLNTNEEKSTIKVIKCSLDDQFCKKDARYAALWGHTRAGEIVHPQIIEYDGILSNKEFFQFCKRIFCEMKTVTRLAQYTFLIGPEKTKILDIKEHRKLGSRYEYQVSLVHDEKELK